MPDVSIHTAHTPEEIARVRELMREYRDFLLHHPTGSAHFCMTGFEHELDSLPAPYLAPGTLLLATVDSRPAGCIGVKPLAPHSLAQQPALQLELKRLWVRPHARGLGLGRRLMHSAIEYARMAGAGAVNLDTVPAAMPEATALYRALGFQPIERYNANTHPGVAYFRLELAPVGSSFRYEPI